MSFDHADKHGPRQDEALEKQTRGLEHGAHESHAQEWREAEPSGEDRPRASLSPDEEIVGGAAAGMGRRDVTDRSELARFLQPRVFPATAGRLTGSAVETGAPDHVVRMLRDLPREERYEDLQDLWRALGGGTEDVTRRA